jgi:hypothetical protein
VEGSGWDGMVEAENDNGSAGRKSFYSVVKNLKRYDIV